MITDEQLDEWESSLNRGWFDVDIYNMMPLVKALRAERKARERLEEALFSQTTMSLVVDDTIVLWNEGKTYSKTQYTKKKVNLVAFLNPYTEDRMGKPSYVYLLPNEKIINLIKEYEGGVVVWSAGGYKWAEIVISTLGLAKHVDLILDKPYKWTDDLTADEVLPQSQKIQQND